MATVNKDFRVKHGLIVEGANATVDGSDIITEDALTGGTQTNVTVTYDAENKVVNFVAESGIGDADTDDLAEGTTNLYYTESRAKTDAAELLTGATKTNITITGDGNGLTITAENGVADSDTDDLTEGTTNLYYTESRAKTDAAELLTGATLTNISITGNGSGLTITAENGVADSTTDDLDEGTTNKYFTDTRAVDAVETAATSTNTANKIVQRDGSGNFAAGTINATGYNIQNSPVIEYTVGPSGSEVTVKADRLVGASNTILGPTSPSVVDDVYLYSENADNKVVTVGELTDAVDALDTDDIEEGTTNLYYTDTRARESVSSGNGLDYNSDTGVFSADLGNGLQIDGFGSIEIDNNVVATQTDLSDDIGAHSDLTTGVHGVTGNVVGTSDAQTLTNKTMGDDLLMDGFQVSGLGTPTQADHAATKSYVDAVSEGLHVHESVRVAVNGNIAIATALENGDSAGGVTLVTGNRVLLKDQTVTSENGIYVVQASGQALRATDFDTAMEVDSGDFVFVSEGTYANTGWVQTQRPATIGTDPILFTQFSGAGTFLAGNGLILDGNVFEIDETITATRTYVQENFVALDDLPGQLDDYIPLTQKAAIDGVATLDGTAQVPLNQLENVTDVIDALTTADIAEDSGSLYFTNTRAVDALEAVVPNFTAVEVNSLAKQVAATTTSLGSVVATAYAFPKATYRTAKFIVKIDNGTHNEVTEVLLSLDSADNIAITEYAIVGTNGSRGTITADISGTDVRLRVDPVNDSTINVVGTLLA